MQNPLTYTDVQVFDAELEQTLAEPMIATTWARAVKFAPCLSDLEADAEQIELVKSTLRTVVLRWNDSGSGAVRQRAAAEYTETLTSYSGGLFRPDEIRDLQALCGQYRTGKASTILTHDEPEPPTVHPFLAPWG